MIIIYNIIIHVYILLIRINSLINTKSKKWIKGREKIFKNLKTNLNNKKNIVWFHCASLGEYEQARQLIISVKKQDFSIKILLTFFSPSGYEIVKKNSEANWVFYLPSDTLNNAKKFISIVKPKKVFFIKSEFWFNYMEIINRNNIPLYHISSVFTKKSILLRLRFCTNLLRKSTHFFVQNNNSLKLLNSIDIKNVTVVGDSRVDSILSDLNKYKKNTKLIKFTSNKPTIIFGSVWPEDEHIYLDFIKAHEDYNYIIAPHDIRYSQQILNKTTSILYSYFIKKSEIKENVLIIDNIGILKYLYQYCKIAYVGGGFGKGIHNISEAAACGTPVIFGPNYLKFIEAHDLIKLKSARKITNLQEFKDAIISFIPSYEKDMAINYFKKRESAVDKIIEIIFSQSN
jgi:3-deoxy-D-manno-octulosonic-acid transferase